MTTSYEIFLNRTPTSEIASRADEVLAVRRRLIGVRGAFECVKANFRLDMRKPLTAGFHRQTMVRGQ
ncbi:MAG: hypothetical protein FWD57_16705 [Polyangiaceae bacterium]|nr:hypothetical protein [Polyangiaceae bacterium]